MNKKTLSCDCRYISGRFLVFFPLPLNTSYNSSPYSITVFTIHGSKFGPIHTQVSVMHLDWCVIVCVRATGTFHLSLESAIYITIVILLTSIFSIRFNVGCGMGIYNLALYRGQENITVGESWSLWYDREDNDVMFADGFVLHNVTIKFSNWSD
jgi:hypothetical protein